MIDYQKCILRPLNTQYAAVIAQWEYATPYDIYNFKDHPLDYLMDEKTWGTEQFALCCGEAVIGQVACQFFEGTLWIGWAQSPAFCGSGNGHVFVKKCVEEIRNATDFRGRIALRVAASNIRAVKAYQRAGFVYRETIVDEVAYSEHFEDFWVMEIISQQEDAT